MADIVIGLNISIAWTAYSQAFLYFAVKYYSLSLNIEQILLTGHSDYEAINKRSKCVFYWLTFLNVADSIYYTIMFYIQVLFDAYNEHPGLIGLALSSP